MSYIVPRDKADRCMDCIFIDRITYDCMLMYDNDYPDFESQYANCPLIELPFAEELAEKLYKQIEKAVIEGSET